MEIRREDLKTGMTLHFENGEKATVLLDTLNGDIVASDQHWGSLDARLLESDENYSTICKITVPKSNFDYGKALALKSHTFMCFKDIPREMSIKQIEEQLGCKIKIVE